MGSRRRYVLFSREGDRCTANDCNHTRRSRTRTAIYQIIVFNELAWLTHGDDRDRVSRRLANALASERSEPEVRARANIRPLVLAL